MLRYDVALIFLLIINISNVVATEKNDFPEYKQTKAGKYLSSKEAFDEIQSGGSKILFLDVRTRAELAVVGMPTVADANVPFMFMAEPMTLEL